MAKNNKKKKGDRPIAKAISIETPVNPFDIHYNKVKRNVVGRKLMRCEQGRPNRARHEAVEKRKKTLLQEYLKKDKTGKFKDKRITDESGGVAARKAKIFDLKMKGVDDTSLTHQGQNLSSENLLRDRPDMDDFDEDVDLNLLKRADYVETAHFGGGDEDGGHRKSQSEYLDEVMNEKRKRQYEQEMNWTLTEKLDEEWKDVRSLLNVQPGKNDTHRQPIEQKTAAGDEEPAVARDYDIVMREMLFASKSSKGKGQENGDSESGSRRVTGSDVPLESPERARKGQQQRSLILTKEQEKRQKVIQRIRDNNVVILPYFEPRLEGLTAKRDPLKKLQKKVKREFRGAQRELRKDSAFLKDVWMKEITERDETRKKKVNRIIADLASDIHDVRSIKRGS